MKNYSRIKRTLHIVEKIALTIAIVVSITITSVIAYAFVSTRSEWEDTHVIKTVMVHSGDTLDGISYEYKPSWMDVREYTYMVMELNDLDNALIYPGDQLKVYVATKHYTVQGLVMDNGDIITTDGNIWSYDTDIKGCVNITFSDYGTNDDITDDAIINIEEVQ